MPDINLHFSKPQLIPIVRTFNLQSDHIPITETFDSRLNRPSETISLVQDSPRITTVVVQNIKPTW